MIEIKELELTQEQCKAIIEAADNKIDKILKAGMQEVIAKTLFISPEQITDYLHDKALEQMQINIFLKTLQVHDAIIDICKLEDEHSKITQGKYSQYAIDRHNKYVDLHNDYVCQILVELALDILDDEEIQEILQKISMKYKIL